MIQVRHTPDDEATPQPSPNIPPACGCSGRLRSLSGLETGSVNWPLILGLAVAALALYLIFTAPRRQARKTAKQALERLEHE